MKTSNTDPIRVDFVGPDDHPILTRLGMTIAPGKKVIGSEWNRDLGIDLTRLKNRFGIETLVSLVETEELEQLGIKELPDVCRTLGVELIRFPLKDGSTPASSDKFVGLIRGIIERLNKGSTVAVHCRGGLGRTGLVSACTVVAVSNGGIDGNRAIEMIRSARPGTIETLEQEEFVTKFAIQWSS